MFSMLIVLTLAFDRSVLYGNVALSILILSKNGTLVLVFQTCFKVKTLKSFKTSSDCTIKIGGSSKRRAILKIPIRFLRGTCGLSIGFKIKPLRRNAFLY